MEHRRPLGFGWSCQSPPTMNDLGNFRRNAHGDWSTLWCLLEQKTSPSKQFRSPSNHSGSLPHLPKFPEMGSLLSVEQPCWVARVLPGPHCKASEGGRHCHPEESNHNHCSASPTIFSRSSWFALSSCALLWPRRARARARAQHQLEEHRLPRQH